MLCQNCQRSEATTHIKRIVRGETAEFHFCHACAENLGMADFFPAFSGFSDTAGMYYPSDVRRMGESVLRCEVCGFSFDDIARTGKPGCPNCYRVFADKLRPTLRKIHGRARHCGRIPAASDEDTVSEYRIEVLKKELNAAIDEQNFERAAQLRDEIKTLSAQRGDK